MEEEALRSIEPNAHHARELSTVAVLQFFNNASSTLSPTFPPENPKGGEVYMYVRQSPVEEGICGTKGAYILLHCMCINIISISFHFHY